MAFKEDVSAIFVTFSKEGTHRYPAAGTDPKLATGKWDDVSFLQYHHRHNFTFKVWIQVFHQDRDIEFIQCKRQMLRWFEGELKIDYMSCEMLSDQLAEKINERWPFRNFTIEVGEDGENGSYKEYLAV